MTLWEGNRMSAIALAMRQAYSLTDFIGESKLQSSRETVTPSPRLYTPLETGTLYMQNAYT